ncbi:MAG: hypothetical protein WD696_22510 [Bryobacteraceae bacterium]
MKLKSYFAGTIESAIRQARKELGEDAMLMNSRKAPPEGRHLGEYEVVFALPDETAQAAPAEAEVPAPLSAAPAAGTVHLANDIAGIRKQIERMAAAVHRSSCAAAGHSLLHPRSAEIFARLTAAEVDGELALEVVRRLELRRPEKHTVEELLRQELSRHFEVSGELGGSGVEQGAGPRVIALVGPPGVGKTITLAKLAVAYGVMARRPTQLLSLDNCRIAAAEQLRCYASILGAGFQAIETVGALAQAVEEHKNKDLILIDTPGCGARDVGHVEDLARFLSHRDDIETHLVLSCNVKPSDLSAVSDRFSVCNPKHLLFTRVDETATHGTIVNESVRLRLPVSFLGSGQTVPDDLEQATKENILDLILNRTPVPAAAPLKTNPMSVEGLEQVAGRRATA